MLVAAWCMVLVLLYFTGIAFYIDLKEKALKQTCRYIPRGAVNDKDITYENPAIYYSTHPTKGGLQ